MYGHINMLPFPPTAQVTLPKNINSEETDNLNENRLFKQLPSAHMQKKALHFMCKADSMGPSVTLWRMVHNAVVPLKKLGLQLTDSRQGSIRGDPGSFCT